MRPAFISHIARRNDNVAAALGNHLQEQPHNVCAFSMKAPLDIISAAGKMRVRQNRHSEKAFAQRLRQSAECFREILAIRRQCVGIFRFRLKSLKANLASQIIAARLLCLDFLSARTQADGHDLRELRQSKADLHAVP